ncbi:MAG: hypothetical protein QOC64_2086 [Solirubrobacteraceae bacterium]|jgi:hypothetical protein|nr:hypothetical protein [Solirubrobacteraceae bacterium]
MSPAANSRRRSSAERASAQHTFIAPEADDTRRPPSNPPSMSVALGDVAAPAR